MSPSPPPTSLPPPSSSSRQVEATRQHFDRFASTWAGFYDDASSPLASYMVRSRLQHVLELCSFFNLGSSRLLEVGCGSGHLLRALDASFHVALDLSPAMLGEARSLSSGNDPSRFVAADATCLPFADESFDAVVAVAVMDYLPLWEDCVQELGRVTLSSSTSSPVQPSSRLVLTFINPGSWFSRIDFWWRSRFQKQKDSSLHRKALSPSEVSVLLQDAGWHVDCLCFYSFDLWSANHWFASCPLTQAAFARLWWRFDRLLWSSPSAVSRHPVRRWLASRLARAFVVSVSR